MIFTLYIRFYWATLKGVLHVQRAMLVHYISGKYVLDLQEDDVYWCTADPGWGYRNILWYFCTMVKWHYKLYSWLEAAHEKTERGQRFPTLVTVGMNC